jgi:lipoprotein-anchoring transpeptidase ErfK/SrfK
MLSRRHFLASGIALAAGSLGGSPALAYRDGETGVYIESKDIRPRKVRMSEEFPEGEIHVYPDDFYLYWTLPDGYAMRYMVGIGRGNLYHPGAFYVGAKKEWPSWVPTPDMLKRQPELFSQYMDGVPGGINNPLGARALYLYTREKGDSYLRIHGTSDINTIGVAVSNGCARLINEQVVELYEQVPLGTKVILHEKSNGEPVHS